MADSEAPNALQKTEETKVGRPRADIDEYFDRIEPYLRIDCSIHEACLEAKVPYTTVVDYYKQDLDFRNKVDAAKNYAVVAARQVVVKAVANGDTNLAFAYLRSKRPDEFATKTRVEHEGEVDVNFSAEFKETVDMFSSPPPLEATAKVVAEPPPPIARSGPAFVLPNPSLKLLTYEAPTLENVAVVGSPRENTPARTIGLGSTDTTFKGQPTSIR